MYKKPSGPFKGSIESDKKNVSRGFYALNDVNVEVKKVK